MYFRNFHTAVHNSVSHWSITVWKNEFTVTQKKFRQIKSSNFFSKNVTFTKFLSKKCDSKFPQFPHCEHFRQKIRESNISTKLLNSRHILWWKWIYRIPTHARCVQSEDNYLRHFCFIVLNKKFVKLRFLLNSLSLNRFHEIFFQMILILSFLQLC